MGWGRTLLRPRWLGLLVVLVAVVIVFVRLGWWQFTVAQDAGIAAQLAEQAAVPALPVEAVLSPHQPFPEDGAGRPVTATGTYDVQGQFVVPGRLLDGATVSWVVTPLVVDATGARLAVVRGALAEEAGAAAPVPPSGQVVVVGTLAPGESPAAAPDLADEGGGDGTTTVRGSVDLSVLANSWPGELYNAFVFSTMEQAAGAGPTPDGSLQAIPPPSFVSASLDWRNVGYALQWWVFAAFAVAMFVRMVHEDARTGRRAEAAQPAPTLGHHV